MMSAKFSSLFPNVAKLLNDGGVLEVHGGIRGMKITSLSHYSELACMFPSKGQDADAVLQHLELLAGRYLSESIVTDEVNGEEYCIE